MSGMQRVCILGATGSIGRSTLEVVALHPTRFEVFALTARHRMDELAVLCDRWQPRYVAVGTPEQAQSLRRRLAQTRARAEVLHGARALEELASHPEVDSVMAAIVGAAGLAPCLAAARAGKRLLLANKEALVVGGDLFMRTVRQGGATLLPIDSEHSAIFQCLPSDHTAWSRHIDHILLTSSGGPFRAREPETLHDVTPEMACAHPNFVMGRKISVDSATMMNKALEVIEARWLFDLRPEQMRVLIHPQQIIHSMVVCRDNSVLAQLGTPDMKVPIAYGLSWPERIESGAERLEFATLGGLHFEDPNPRRFPGLLLAFDALRAAAGATNALNAANEEAVAAFLSGAIAFTAIHQVNAATLDSLAGAFGSQDTLEDLLALDERARAAARVHVKAMAR